MRNGNLVCHSFLSLIHIEMCIRDRDLYVANRIDLELSRQAGLHQIHHRLRDELRFLGSDEIEVRRFSLLGQAGKDAPVDLMGTANDARGRCLPEDFSQPDDGNCARVCLLYTSRCV